MASASSWFTKNHRGKIRFEDEASGCRAVLTTCRGEPLIYGKKSDLRADARKSLDAKLLRLAMSVVKCKTDSQLKALLAVLGMKVVGCKLMKGKHRHVVLTRTPLKSVRRYAKGVLKHTGNA